MEFILIKSPEKWSNKKHSQAITNRTMPILKHSRNIILTKAAMMAVIKRAYRFDNEKIDDIKTAIFTDTCINQRN